MPTRKLYLVSIINQIREQNNTQEEMNTHMEWTDWMAECLAL